MGEFSKKRTTKNADSALSETFTNSAEQGVISQLDYFDHGITNDANISGYYVVQPDDFVYNPRISATAPCGPINRNRLNRAGVMSPLYTVFSVDSSVDKTYLEHYFKTSRWHVFMLLEGNSGARSDRFSISEATFFEMPIWCPEASEQRAIARQLETTDALITLHQRECWKASFIRPSAWEQRKLNEHLTVSGEKNLDGDYGREDVLSVSRDFGVVNQIEFQGRSYAGASVLNYSVLHHGGIVYTKSPLSSNPFGIIKSNKGSSGIVSTLYAVYSARDNAEPDFVDCYFQQDDRLNRYLHPLVNKGAKNDMKVSAENALLGLVCFPERQEQKMIAAFFASLDNLITLHQRQQQESSSVL